MNIESAKTKYYGNSSEAIKDGKYNLGSSTEGVKPFSSSFSKESNVTFTPRPKRTPNKVKNPEPNVKENTTKTINKSSLKNSKLHLPEELVLTFTAGTVDFTFPYGSGYGFNQNVNDIKVQSDGKILVAGDFDYYYYDGDSFYSPYLCRLNADGTFDDTFDTTNGGSQNAFNNSVNSIHIQSNGKIVVGGEFTYFDRDGGYNSYYIARLNSDGTYDNTFFIGDGFNGSVYKIIGQEDGKLIVGGVFDYYNNVPNWRIIRLLENGSTDSTFNTGNGFNWDDYGYVNDIIKLSNGKILVGGYFYNYDGTNTNNIARLNNDGSYDTTFEIGNGFSDEVTSIAIQSDGKIIVGGWFDYFNYTYLYSGYIVRLTSDGQLDTTFGYGLNNGVISLAIQSDDKILVGGFFGEFYPDNYSTIEIDELVRFHSDCTLDTSFYYQELLSDGVYSIVILNDDKILIGGEFDNNGDETIWPLNHFGKINNKILEYPYVNTFIDCGIDTLPFPIDNYQDFTYVVGSKTPFDSNKTYSFESLSNPSQTVCGVLIDEFPSVNVGFKNIAEYDDCYTALNDISKLVSAVPYLGALPGNFEILVSKKFNVGDYLYYDRLFIESGDPVYFHGTFQITEELPFGNSNIINLVEPYIPYETGDESIEANGQYIVTIDCISEVSTVALTNQPSLIDEIVLVQPNGTSPCKSLDFPPSYFSPYYGDLLRYETISGGTPVLKSSLIFDNSTECLTNFSNKGILDTNFYDGGFNGDLVYTTVEQPDGKILVGGTFNEYDGTYVGNFMRLNADGTLDETFYNGEFDSYVKAIALQPDGKILVGGDFNYYDGEFAGKIIRLNSDGTIDQSFTYGEEFNNLVRAIAIQKDGKIIVGGNFNYYYDFYCPKIIRLNIDGTPDTTFVVEDGFGGGNVYTINVESVRNTPFYNTNGPITYTETILVGGNFSEYKNNQSGAIARLNSNGDLLSSFGVGFVEYERVFDITRLTDGKLLIVGSFTKYNDTDTPYGIVRLNSDYTVDDTFKAPSYLSSNGGFNDYIVDSEVLANGKIMIGGQFDCYTDDNGEHCNLGYLVRLNSDGTLDDTFNFKITDNYVNKITLLSDTNLLLGGWFNSPTNKLLKLFANENYELRTFTTCDGDDSFIYVNKSENISISGSLTGVTEISYEEISIVGLDLVYDGDNDDDNFVIVMPTPFDINFLGTNYTSVNVSTNPYITFGDGGDPSDCCFDIPNEIPTGPQLPGVFLSFQCPDNPGDYDSDMYQLYSGLTDGGNTMVIKYIGTDHCDEIANLVYGFKFYKDNSEYFDLIIESNDNFFNDDPTGGVSNGVDETWLATFDSTGGKAYRIGNYGVPTAIKGTINTTPLVCGQLGNTVDIISGGGTSQGGSMYFDGTNNTTVTAAYNVAMDLDFESWSIEWFQKFTSTQSCCLRVFDIGSFAQEHVGASIENNRLAVWIESSSYFYDFNTDVTNTWTHLAITSEDIGYPNRTLRVFQDGVQLGTDITISVDLNNFDGPTLLPLTIGGMGNGNDCFEGYITNFRWNKGTCYYTSNFTVPTSPLTVDGSDMLLLATDSGSVITDSTGLQATSTVSVTWSSQSPFTADVYDLYTLTDTTEYEDCDTCNSTVRYKAILYTRDGVNPDKIEYVTMKESDITKMLTLGPIATTRGPECYELLKYYL